MQTFIKIKLISVLV